MKGKKRTILLLWAGLLGLYGCGSPSSNSEVISETITEAETETEENKKADLETESGLVYESSMELQYAENFTVDYYEGGYTLLTTTMDNEKFLIVPEGRKAPEGLGEETVALQRPIKNIYLVASAAMDIFSELDGLDAITLSGQKEEGWYIEAAREAMAKGDILYAGKYDKPDYELIVSKNCTLEEWNGSSFLALYLGKKRKRKESWKSRQRFWQR